MRWIGPIGAVSAGLAVVLGAFGAHALRDVLDARALEIWQAATHYQAWHALALILLALTLRDRPPSRVGQGAGVAFVVGSVAFCGSLYALALGAPRWCGAITPVGGVALILGWILFAACWRRDARG